MFLELLFKNPLYFIAAVLVVIVSVCLHEMAHALAAYYIEGDDTAKKQGFFFFNPWVQMGPSSLVFLMLFGICWGQTPVNRSRFRHGRLGESIVSLAGPVMNLLLLVASIAGLIGLIGLKNDNPLIIGILGLMASRNALLFLFNMLPVPPLDGFGVLEPLVPALRQHTKAFYQYGFLMLMLGFYFLHLGDWLWRQSDQMVSFTFHLLSGRF